MDGILVQDSDWSRKLSRELYSLLKKKQLCDLGIVCSAQNDVANIRSSEVVMVHRCVLSAASETIKHLSVGGQVYNLVKINGINISIECWNSMLEFVYCGRTVAHSGQLCDIRRAAHVLQIKELERSVDAYHDGYQFCVCPNRDPVVNSIGLTPTSNTYVISSEKWLNFLFENMLDLLVKQTLCNMTIITEKADKSSAEIMAHLCMLVAASNTIRELVLQGSETYNSVKIDSIAYNTWLYLLEYVYTSRVSIVKGNIPEVWVASQLLQIDGLANAVSPFASQISVIQGGREGSADPLLDTSTSVKSSQALNQSALLTTVDLLNSVKTEHDLAKDVTQYGSLLNESLDSEAIPSLDTDDNKSISLSLNSDSCDIHGVNGLNQMVNMGLPGSDSDHNMADGSGLSDDILAEIKQEMGGGIPASESPFNGSAVSEAIALQLATSSIAHSVAGGTQLLLSNVLSAGGQLIQGGQLIPIQAAGALLQGSQLNWLQTVGVDVGAPTMLLLTQGIIPMVATSQASTEGTQSTVLSLATSPLAAATSLPGAGGATPRRDVTQCGVGVVNSTAESSSSPEQSAGKVGGKVQIAAKLCFCQKCEKVFAQSPNSEHRCSGVLQSEAVSTTARAGTRPGADTNRLQCKHCQKVFSRTWTLNVHLRTHTGERPYKCNICNKAFSDKSNMRQHTLIHTQNKQYHCPSCHQAFAQKRYMKKHFMETCRRKVSNPDSINLKDVSGVQVTELSKAPTHMGTTQLVFMDDQHEMDMIKTERTSPASVPEVGSSTGMGAQWQTTMLLSCDDLTLSHDEESDSEHAQLIPEETPVEPLMCMSCKKHFKTERQRNSHRCINL